MRARVRTLLTIALVAVSWDLSRGTAVRVAVTGDRCTISGVTPSKPLNGEDAVVLARYLDIRRAEMAVSILEGSSIEAFVNIPYTSSMFPHFMLDRGGVAVFVRREDLEAARELLDSAGEGLGELPPGG